MRPATVIAQSKAQDAGRLVLEAVRNREDTDVLARSPLATLSRIQEHARLAYPRQPLGVGFALRDFVVECIAAAEADVTSAFPAGPDRADDQRAVLAALLEGRTIASTAKLLGIPTSSQRFRNLYRVRYLLVRHFLQEAGVLHRYPAA